MTELGRFRRIDLREIWSIENQDFTPWLAKDENVAVLSEALQMELQLEAVERSVGPNRADILCRNTDGGGRVLIENQLERTNHKHLGQVLTYAAGLQVASICWIAANFTDEHRAALDWLNEVTNEQFQFFGLEVELWRIDDSRAAPKFNVVSKPNSWSRSVKRDNRSVNGKPTPRQQQQLEFWSRLMEQLKEVGSPINPKKPQAQGWMEFSIGRADFWLEATLTPTKKRVSVSLFMGGQAATAYFDLLKEQREEIESALGPVEWRPLPDKLSSSIRLCQTETDATQEQDWPRQVEWMASTLGRFHSTFRPRVSALDAADWQGDHNPGDE